MFGSLLQHTILEAGINADHLIMDPKIPTTLAFVQTFPNGDRDSSFYRKPGADMMLTVDELPEDTIRASERVFRADAKISTFDTGSDCVLGVCRELDGERFLGLFNFSEKSTDVFLGDIPFIDLAERDVSMKTAALPAYGFLWLKRSNRINE